MRIVNFCGEYLGTFRGFFTRPLAGRLCGASVQTFRADEADAEGYVLGFHLCTRGHQTFFTFKRG